MHHITAGKIYSLSFHGSHAYQCSQTAHHILYSNVSIQLQLIYLCPQVFRTWSKQFFISIHFPYKKLFVSKLSSGFLLVSLEWHNDKSQTLTYWNKRKNNYVDSKIRSKSLTQKCKTEMLKNNFLGNVVVAEVVSSERTKVDEILRQTEGLK